MPDKQKKSHQDRRKLSAQALVEVALVLPIILLLVMGAMDFGRMFYTKIVLTNAAREGANYLAYYPDDKDAGYVETYNSIITEATSSNVVVGIGDVIISGCCTRGQPVRVSVTKSMDLDLRWLFTIGRFAGWSGTVDRYRKDDGPMRTRRRFSGQSLVEFALIFPIVFLLITGFLDLGRAVFYYSSISNSVREGTRYAIVHKIDIDDTAKINGYPVLKQQVRDFSFGIDTSTLVIDVHVAKDVTGKFFEKVTITGTYTFVPITPGIKEIFGTETGIDLVAQSTMLVSPGSR